MNRFGQPVPGIYKNTLAKQPHFEDTCKDHVVITAMVRATTFGVQPPGEPGLQSLPAMQSRDERLSSNLECELLLSSRDALAIGVGAEYRYSKKGSIRFDLGYADFGDTTANLIAIGNSWRF